MLMNEMAAIKVTVNESSRELERPGRRVLQHVCRDSLILVLTIAACAVPFIGQPFHMDDGLYLDLARNARQNPWFPNDLPYVFQGIFYPDMGSHSHPPLQTYFLAAIQHPFGEGPGTEWIYHLCALFFPVLAVLSFYWICALYLARPLWPALMLACAPLFLVIQHTLMTDVPMLAYWLAAISAYLWAAHLGRPALYWLSALFQMAAVFTSYQALALIPLLGFYQVRKGRGLSGWLSLAVAPAAIVTWYALSCHHYGRPLWEVTAAYIQSRSPFSTHVLGTKLLAILEYQGWLFIFPLFLLYLLGRGLKWRALFLPLVAAVYLAQFRIPEYRLIDKGIFVVGLVSGFFVIFEMGKAAWRAISRKTSGAPGRVQAQFLQLWYFGYFAFCLFFLTEGSARYILPMLPPFVLWFFHHLGKSESTEHGCPAGRRWYSVIACGSLAMSLAWGLLLSQADLEFARIYPQAAADVSRVVKGEQAFSVGEWGFRYYLEDAGIGPLPADASPVRSGDFVVIPQLAVPHALPAGLQRAPVPIATFSYRPRTPLRVLDVQTPAAFYSTGWGVIPFSVSREAQETIEIFRVEAR